VNVWPDNGSVCDRHPSLAHTAAAARLRYNADYGIGDVCAVRVNDQKLWDARCEDTSRVSSDDGRDGDENSPDGSDADETSLSSQPSQEKQNAPAQ
jgi:hypothetical protein